MKIIVCLKPVPDPKEWGKLKLDPKTKTLVRAGIGSVINPLDKHALEAALTLREKLGGQVLVVSMAPPDAGPVLKEALAMGADEAYLLSDRAFAGSDTLGTAHVLAQGIKDLGGCDLVLCGNETIDGGTAQVSAQIAEYLDMPNLMHVSHIEASGEGVFTVHTGIGHGRLVIEISPPMVLSVVKEMNTPRYITMMDILDAEEKPVHIWSGEKVCVLESCVGLANSPTQMADLFIPQKKKQAEMLTGAPAQQAKELAERLKRLGFC